MRYFTILLTSVLTFGCTTYSSGDLNGKWECIIDCQNIELWISDTLAMGFNIDNQLMNTYEVGYNGRMLTFTFIDHMKSSAPWREKVLSLTENEFQTELQIPGNKQITIYRKTSKEAPEISPNSEVNWDRYEEYMKAKLGNTN